MYVNGEHPPNIYEAILPPASSAVPNMNTPVPTSHQNVILTLPPYSVPAETMVWNSPPSAPQWRLATVMPQCLDSSSPFYRIFLTSKPKALGIVMIVAAVLQIGLGICLTFSVFNISLRSGIPFWGPVFYIIAGALTIAAQCKPNICLLKGSLSLNIISAIISLVAFILHSVDLAIIRCYYYNYYYYNNNYYDNYDYNRCQGQLIGGYVVESLLLVINLLLFSVSLSISICGCRSLSHVPQTIPQVFLIQTDGLVSMNPSTTIPAFPPPAQPPPPRYTAEKVTTGPTT